jgi:CxxC-x17-CxxC domain-containing protein
MAELEQKTKRGGHSMNLQEKSVDCFDCGLNFTFSIEEQQAFQAKGYTHAPKRCPSCRLVRRSCQMKSNSFKRPLAVFQPARQLFTVTCFKCAKSTQVPFEPKEGRPVYCRDCYNAFKISR